MNTRWIQRISQHVDAKTIASRCTYVANEDLELGFRLFDSAVPLINHNRIPFNCNILEQSRLLTKRDIDYRIKGYSNNINNTIYDALISRDWKPEKFKSVDSRGFDIMLGIFLKRKLKVDALGWFNYYPEPDTFVYSKIFPILLYVDPKCCLDLYIQRQNEILPMRDTYLDNIGLRCYMLFGDEYRANILFNTMTRDDYSYAYMIKGLLNNNTHASVQTKSELLFQEFLSSNLVMTCGSAKVFSNFLLSRNRYNELKELLGKSRAVAQSPFGFVLSLALFSAIKQENTQVVRQIIEDFDALQYVEVNSVLEYHNSSFNLLIRSRIKNEQVTANINLSKHLSFRSSIPISYINNKTEWEPVLSTFNSINLATINSITLEILLYLIVKKTIISREIDAEILSLKLLNKPLPDRLNKFLLDDKFIKQIFNLPFLSLQNRNTLVEGYLKIGLYNPCLEDLESILNLFDVSPDVRSYAIGRWFSINKVQSGVDYHILARNIKKVLASDRSKTFSSHFRWLFLAFVKKQRIHRNDKEIYLQLMMNFSYIDAAELEIVMRRYYATDKLFIKEVYQMFSPIANGKIIDFVALTECYWRSFNKKDLIKEFQETLDHFKPYLIKHRFAELTLERVLKSPESELKESYIKLLKNALESEENEQSLPLATYQIATLVHIHFGLKLIASMKD